MLSLLRRWFSSAPGPLANPAPQTLAVAAAPLTDPEPHWRLAAADHAGFIMQLYQPLLGGSLDYLERPLLLAQEKLLHSRSGGSDLLPRVPAILPQVLKSLRDKNLSTADLAQQISRDVVLVAELLQEVRRPVYNARLSGAQPLQQLDKAIQLLGVNGMRLLIAKNAFRPLIQNQRGPLTQQMAPLLWQHTDLAVQAVSQLARLHKIDELPVFLAALLANTGIVITLRAADQMGLVQRLPERPEFIQALLRQAHQLSVQTGRHWEFPEQVCSLLEASAAPSADLAVNLLQQAGQLALLRLMQLRQDPQALLVQQHMPDRLATLLAALELTQA